MKILYGIQGTGNGHLTRSRILIRLLRKRGIHVDVLISARKKEEFSDDPDFRHSFFKKGLTFVINQGQVNKFNTFLNLNPLQFFYDIATFKNSSYDLVITDYEPISSKFALFNKIPSLGIGHQYSFLHKATPIVDGYKLDHFVLKHFAPATFSVGLHWHHFDSFILPPIISPLKSVNSIQNKVLVYLPWESLPLLKTIFFKLSHFTFYVYHSHISHIHQTQNIIWNPISFIDFKKNLVNCDYVLTNSGFELISEALDLNKKIISKPVFKQVEQLSNAKALKELNYANIIYDISTDTLSKAFNEFKVTKSVSFNTSFSPLVDWILAGNWDNQVSLLKHFWN